MSRADLFPDAHRDGQDDRIATCWDLSWPLPVPARGRALRCPVCGVGQMVLKDWRFHKVSQGGSKSPWRCDVRLKCLTCSHVPIFGIAVTRAYYDAGVTSQTGTRWIGWREGKALLAEAGFFEE